MTKTGLEKSMSLFDQNERNIYGAIQMTIENPFALLNWRKNDKGTLCIIEFLKNGKGYRIYEMKTENVEQREIFKPRQQELDF